MDEFEKKLEYQAQMKAREADVVDSTKSIFLDGFASGKKWMAEDILNQYRSMTCKMMSHNDAMNPYMIRYECSNCREWSSEPDKYCTHCGAEVVENDKR